MSTEHFARHSETLRDAVAASIEEAELESVVAVVGTQPAQEAATSHHLPELLEELNGHA